MNKNLNFDEVQFLFLLLPVHLETFFKVKTILISSVFSVNLIILGPLFSSILIYLCQTFSIVSWFYKCFPSSPHPPVFYKSKLLLKSFLCALQCFLRLLPIFFLRSFEIIKSELNFLWFSILSSCLYMKVWFFEIIFIFLKGFKKFVFFKSRAST